MTKKIIPLGDYITASHAAQLLSDKLGRNIRPGRVCRLKNIRFVSLNATTKLYNRHDVEACVIRQKRA